MQLHLMRSTLSNFGETNGMFFVLWAHLLFTGGSHCICNTKNDGGGAG